MVCAGVHPRPFRVSPGPVVALTQGLLDGLLFPFGVCAVCVHGRVTCFGQMPLHINLHGSESFLGIK